MEATCEETIGIYTDGTGMPEQFSITISLRRGSAFTNLLFIVVIDKITRKVIIKDATRTFPCTCNMSPVVEQTSMGHRKLWMFVQQRRLDMEKMENRGFVVIVNMIRDDEMREWTLHPSITLLNRHHVP